MFKHLLIFNLYKLYIIIKSTISIKEGDIILQHSSTIVHFVKCNIEK